MKGSETINILRGELWKDAIILYRYTPLHLLSPEIVVIDFHRMAKESKAQQSSSGRSNDQPFTYSPEKKYFMFFQKLQLVANVVLVLRA